MCFPQNSNHSEISSSQSSMMKSRSIYDLMSLYGFLTKHGDKKESRFQPTKRPSRHPHPNTHPHTHTHPHTPTHTPARAQEKPTRRREAKQEQAPPGQGHQRRNLDIQSPNAVTSAVPAPPAGSHPKKVAEVAGCSHSKFRASSSSGTASSSTEEEL